jgi:hypothetical protein
MWNLHVLGVSNSPLRDLAAECIDLQIRPGPGQCGTAGDCGSQTIRSSPDKTGLKAFGVLGSSENTRLWNTESTLAVNIGSVRCRVLSPARHGS